MGKHPKLDELDYLFEKGGEILLSGSVYEEKTGASLPKDKRYLINRSALSRWVKDKGYIIFDVQEKPIIETALIIKKK